MAHSSGYDSYGYPTANMAPDILTKSRGTGDHGFPREAATKGQAMGYALVSQFRTPEDSSKPGTVKDWHYETGYFQRPLAKNKAPEPPMAMDYGAMGPFFKV